MVNGVTDELVEARVWLRKTKRDQLLSLARLTDQERASIQRQALYLGLDQLLAYWARQWGVSIYDLRPILEKLEPGQGPEYRPANLDELLGFDQNPPF